MELTGQVTIVVNGNGPQIQCTGPRDGDMIVAAPGNTVMVTGTVDDASGIAEVRVNGSLATLDGGSFQANVTTEFGINFVDVVARDSFGTESTATCAFLASARYAGRLGPGRRHPPAPAKRPSTT
ncbi:MAG: Ig-like domain-containing protein [Polyangiales bacterium]